MKNNALTFLYLYITGFLISGFILLAFPKGAFVLFINSHYTPFLDIFFKYITHLGNGILFLVMALILWAFKKGYLKELLFTAIIQAVFVNVFKRLIFHGALRPKAYFGDTISLHFVDGVSVHSLNAFPSGHTATAFGIAMLLALTIFRSKPAGQIFVFFMAFLVAYSRMYLLQHFFIDVWFGSLLGISSAIFSVRILLQYKVNKIRFKQALKNGKNTTELNLRNVFQLNRFL